MIHPAWWPRVSCVYCGARTDESDPIDPNRRRHPRACWRHQSLVPLDLSTSGDGSVDELLGSPRAPLAMMEAE